MRTGIHHVQYRSCARRRTVLISDGKVSTEKLKKHPAMEYTVLDKAHRIKLTDEMLEAAGIESNKVRVDVQDGRLVISRI